MQKNNDRRRPERKTHAGIVVDLSGGSMHVAIKPTTFSRPISVKGLLAQGSALNPFGRRGCIRHVILHGVRTRWTGEALAGWRLRASSAIIRQSGCTRWANVAYTRISSQEHAAILAVIAAKALQAGT